MQSISETKNILRTPPPVVGRIVACPETPVERDHVAHNVAHRADSPQEPPAAKLARGALTDQRFKPVASAVTRRRKRRSWRSFLATQRRHVTSLKDAPPWLVSLILHLVLMIVLALITFQSKVGSSLWLTFKQGDGPALTALTEFTLQSLELDSVALAEPFMPDLSWQPIRMDVPIELPTLSSLSAPRELAAHLEKSLAIQRLGAAEMGPSTMFSGRTGAMKQALLRSGGGTQETEAAVALGLAWLKRQQRPDGSWSMVGPYDGGSRSENQTAATSMAMLAFMGAGNTHKSGEYRQQVHKAIRWLVKQQGPNGFMAQRARGNEKMYAQAQATIAVCELYGMTGDYWLQPYAQRACDFACESQSPQGGWRYEPRSDSDTSVTGWFVMGLKSGKSAGLEINGYVFPRVEEYLESVGSDYNAGYAYQPGRPASPSMTAEGLLCRQYLGWHRNMPGMSQGLSSLVANHLLNVDRSDVYYWYYATQSLHHYGGPLWEEWNAKLRVDVPAKQEKRGAERGSWSPNRDAWGATAGRLYTTCLSLYCLEVYYRHMPLYDLEDQVAATQ
ncbi:prenyltransferase/squalene oxidase repeat-containing protein [Aureliella helgolandensis]|uniref:Prenyltransferase and squalene oxidase repeat protein n=1 Tax=Aureliella helgolandensis TaxID=2527968 RepID=A0A518G467_9BACT|nr:prenyltransferase/squalene oxidase repeat-containing protein [Aureliella helgolandensis]QDV23339.1 Prenyltransferase and squalene oxidase repeat protein [Aureliella helgolandensis]